MSPVRFCRSLWRSSLWFCLLQSSRQIRRSLADSFTHRDSSLTRLLRHWIRWFHTAASRWRWSAVQTSRPACRWRGRCRPCRPSPSTEWCWRQPELRGFVWPRPWASPGLQADTRLNPPGPRLCWTWTTRPQSLCSCGPWGCRWRSTSHWLELWSNLEDGNRKQRRLNVVFFLCHEELRLYHSTMETFINYEVI